VSTKRNSTSRRYRPRRTAEGALRFIQAVAVAVGATSCAGGSGDDGIGSDGSATAPVYALVTHVWSDDGPTGYVALMNSLDTADVSLETAREFPGYTSVGVADGQLLVNPSAEDLTIERFHITDDLDWEEAGALSFLGEGAEEVGFYRQYLSRDQDAYLDVDVTGRVIWDPIAFEVHGPGPETDLSLQQDSLDLFANFNRAYFVSDGEMLRPFSYHDQDWFRWSADTLVAVYDTTTHETREVLRAPCPGLDTITRDEDGNTYLGTWEYSALHPLMGTGPVPCVVRLTPQNTLDEGWNPDLTDMTGGRHVVNFRYVGAGKAVAAVLHAEEYGDGYDFTRLTERVDDFWAAAANFHRLWIFDLAMRTAARVQGIEAFDFVNPGFFHAVIDGRVFLLLGDGSSNNSATTVVYELEGSGRATRKFEVPGGVIQWVSVR
jgi:hypothetical protein